jgi:hypothetical protein
MALDADVPNDRKIGGGLSSSSMHWSLLGFVVALCSAVRADTSLPRGGTETFDACLVRFQEIQRVLSSNYRLLRDPRIRHDEAASELQWGLGTDDCDGYAFTLRIEPKHEKAGGWRLSRREKRVSARRSTGKLNLLVTAETNDGMDEFANEFVTRMSAALDSCMP